MSAPRCPECGSREVAGQEYPREDPNRYDGISEWHCLHCGVRWGRWSGRVLIGDDAEGRYGHAPR